MSCHAMQYNGKTSDGRDLYICGEGCGEEWAVSNKTGVQTLRKGRGQVTESDQQQLRQMVAEGRIAEADRQLGAVPCHTMDRKPPAVEFALRMACGGGGRCSR